MSEFLNEKSQKKQSCIFIKSLLYSIDNIFCDRLRRLRHQVGYPWAILLEGHGWWHIGTGWGAYLIVVASELLMLSIKETGSNFEIRGPALFPHVKRIKAYKGTRHPSSNGLVKARKTE